MIVSKVVLTNFRQYFGSVEVNLRTSGEKNLIVIGGKNGHGKTNFLVGLVWCLYGQSISEIDEVFRKEVKGGYSRFLNKALNWTAKNDSITYFSVRIEFENVELSEGFQANSKTSTNVIIERLYDTMNGSESLTILVDGNELELLKENEEKLTFINDYLIPLQAAKFVFFDAEKIADIAELNLTEQGRIMNEALGKLLGLNTYESLAEDLITAQKNLKKESATHEILLQIDSFENKRLLNREKIIGITERINEIEDSIASNQHDIKDIGKFLSDHGSVNDVDLSDLYNQKRLVEERKSEYYTRYYEYLEIIPFCISAGKLQELVSQLQLEEERRNAVYEHEDFLEKSNVFVENLFNREPYPNDDISFKQKAFYFQKATELIDRIFLGGSSLNKETFEHDLSRTEIQNVFSIYEALKRANNEALESIYKEIMLCENEFNKVTNDIRKAEGEIIDDEIALIKKKKTDLQNEINELLIEMGRYEQEKIICESENESFEIRIENLLSKVSVSKSKAKELEEITKYIGVLKNFIDSEKMEKHKAIEKNILYELKRLMHKRLIHSIKVRIIPDNKGLEVLLFNENGTEILKEDLSKGEQQLYVSCLLKSILNESISDLPVFIDTPLGRLDKEHKENILKNYYPTLSDQVVVFSTDDEITRSRYESIKNIVANSFTLANIDGNTQIFNGYFN
jgi:DNA sulfur modification protein DndD